MLNVDGRVLEAVAGSAAIVGGAFWAVKAGAIMITGVQPRIIYEIAPFFFAVAVVGLSALLDPPRPGYAKVGSTLAACGALATIVVVAGLAVGPPEWEPAADAATVLTPFIVVANVGTLVGLLLVGIAARRTNALVGSAATLPILLSLSTIPLIALGDVLGSIHPRLFEAPTFVVGIGWMALGTALARRSRPRASRERTASD